MSDGTVRIPDEEYEAILNRLDTDFKDADRHFIIREESQDDRSTDRKE